MSEEEALALKSVSLGPKQMHLLTLLLTHNNTHNFESSPVFLKMNFTKVIKLNFMYLCLIDSVEPAYLPSQNGSEMSISSYYYLRIALVLFLSSCIAWKTFH